MVSSLALRGGPGSMLSLSSLSNCRRVASATLATGAAALDEGAVALSIQEACAELCVRNSELFAGHLLLGGDLNGAFYDAVAEEVEATCEAWTRRYDIAQEFAAGDRRAHFATTPPVFDGSAVLLRSGRGRDALAWMIAGVHGAAPQVPVYVVGHKREGIDSAPRTLGTWYSDVSLVDRARRCALYRLDGPRSDAPCADSLLRRWSLPGTRHEVVADPGVFSSAELDAGSAMLIEALPKRSPERMLDIACGAGVVGLSALDRYPDCALTFCDVDAGALDATRRAVAAAGSDARVLASNVYSDVTGRFRLIAANPPFHDGVATRHDVAPRIIAGAWRHLSRSGTLLIVANRFLRYQPLLEDVFRQVDIVNDDGKFRVYAAREPRRPRSETQ